MESFTGAIETKKKNVVFTGNLKMKTLISDTFPLDKLECAYFDICRDFNPKVCKYTDACELRQWYKQVIEPYMPRQNLELQVRMIIEEDGRNIRKNKGR